MVRGERRRLDGSPIEIRHLADDDRAAVSADDHSFRPGRPHYPRAGIACWAEARVENAYPLFAQPRPGSRARVSAPDQVVDLVGRPPPVDPYLSVFAGPLVSGLGFV